MNLVLDSSSAINLHHGNALEVVLGLVCSGFTFCVGAIVRDECGELRDAFDVYAHCGRIVLLPDDTLIAAEFTRILNLYELGLGETECIALAEQRGLTVCTDDKAARMAAIRHLGEGRVLGSLRLLRTSVCERLITSDQAWASYLTMKMRGAFLPNISHAFFDSSKEAVL